ncbi:MAG: tyrosine-type recombinase/integrase [Candidatus Tectomicrobia bacterium]|nr:tyrosine-type recombinase/integrase [Candidatus Tectomicrobia bacterium]
MANPQPSIKQFRAYLERRHYASHTVESYGLDLHLFFANRPRLPATITHQDVEDFVESHHMQNLAPTTINRRLYALKHFFDFLLEKRQVLGNPVKPSHFAREGRPLPRALTVAQIQALFAQMKHPMDRALFGLMLRCGLRVSEAVALRRRHIDWDQCALLIEQGKGRKDRRGYLCPEAAEMLREALALRPKGVPGDAVFWNRKRPTVPLSDKAIQKKIERLAKAAGIEASCHSLRHTFASNLLEHGAELVAIKDLLGHTTVTASQRYARLSNQKVKEEYLRTMKKVMRQTKV